MNWQPTVDLITDIAEGLNRSLQVDNPSLENLRGPFKGIKRFMKGKTGETQIAYRQGDPGEVDILQVLTSLAMFDLQNYPDRKTHPNGLFGRPKALLNAFTKDAADEDCDEYGRRDPSKSPSNNAGRSERWRQPP